jgi:hypothetical protein
MADAAEAGVDEVGVAVEATAFEADVCLETGLVEEGVTAERQPPKQAGP